ncbi:hypothetical protein J2D73_17235 [Acetobacter sacchari]|uniref:Uncharacterized protein n=1 Tax=Acetobacter sacchari TaxID=2661687 RepID=A0ABS3M040_9PROT|nr:hypothetical protein [Acetobacter sacchari]
MKFFALIETAAGSGQYALGASVIEADSTGAALALITAGVGAGLRYGAWPYRELRGLPAFAAPATDEVGKAYTVLAQATGADQLFVADGQTLTSTLCDASNLCLSMQAYMGFRVGLMPAGEAPVAKPSTSGGSTDAGTPDAGSPASGASGNDDAKG